MRAYSKKDVDKKALKGARIAVVGYGSQGRAHALNLKDSGYDVVIGVRKGASWKKAKKGRAGGRVPAEAVKGATLVALLTPDTPRRENYKEILPNLAKGPRCCSRTASTSTSARSSHARTSTSC
jgi:ketol-acid reductoisomerase